VLYLWRGPVDATALQELILLAALNLFLESRESKVRHLDVPLGVEKEVKRLEVPMGDACSSFALAFTK
jgi:hypothetical protein